MELKLTSVSFNLLTRFLMEKETDKKIKTLISQFVFGFAKTISIIEGHCISKKNY